MEESEFVKSVIARKKAQERLRDPKYVLNIRKSSAKEEAQNGLVTTLAIVGAIAVFSGIFVMRKISL